MLCRQCRIFRLFYTDLRKAFRIQKSKKKKNGKYDDRITIIYKEDANVAEALGWETFFKKNYEELCTQLQMELIGDWEGDYKLDPKGAFICLIISNEGKRIEMVGVASNPGQFEIYSIKPNNPFPISNENPCVIIF